MAKLTLGIARVEVQSGTHSSAESTERRSCIKEKQGTQRCVQECSLQHCSCLTTKMSTGVYSITLVKVNRLESMYSTWVRVVKCSVGVGGK